MKFTELTFPITLVAPDGWARRVKNKQGLKEWTIPAIDKYNRIGFVVADSAGRLYEMTTITPNYPITRWDRIRAIFSSRARPVTIELQPMQGDPLTLFRERFLAALERDDDCLTQFHSKDKIATLVRDTSPLPKLLEILDKMHVTG